MKPFRQWLAEYGADHRHPLNKRIHYVCVPAIFVSVLGLLWEIPPPWPHVHWTYLAIALAVPYYLALDRLVGIAMLAVSLAACALFAATGGRAAAWIWVGVFVAAWIGQFYGHVREGRKPSFLTDLAYLLIGPAWIVNKILRPRDPSPASQEYP